jgi:ferredoxin-fold anticodon binding domain-containing protein
MANKIKEEQLKELQEKVSVIQQIQGQVGNIEGQKHLLLHQLATSQEELQKLQKTLEDEYGKVSINIQDGSYEEIVEEAVEA